MRPPAVFVQTNFTASWRAKKRQGLLPHRSFFSRVLEIQFTLIIAVGELVLWGADLLGSFRVMLLARLAATRSLPSAAPFYSFMLSFNCYTSFS